jgi:macrolide transport system ATP-binding/permease protein
MPGELMVQDLGFQETGRIMAIGRGLGSDPALLLQSEDWSQGETRKLMPALNLAGEPSLIIPDEPTDHMDLPSEECLENALECFSIRPLQSFSIRFLMSFGNIFLFPISIDITSEYVSGNFT